MRYFPTAISATAPPAERSAIAPAIPSPLAPITIAPATPASARRVEGAPAPFQDRDDPNPWNGKGPWPARWIICANAGDPPFVAAFRLQVTLPHALTFRAVVTADERYELFLDGARVGRGPERGDALHWFYETYELSLSAGKHVLVARTWSIGAQRPHAQLSTRPGFLFAPVEVALLARFATGHAPWQAKLLGGYAFTDPFSAWGTGARIDLDGARYPWGVEAGRGTGWLPAASGAQACDDVNGHAEAGEPLLVPAPLPAMSETLAPAARVRFVARTEGGAAAEIAVRSGDHLGAEAREWQDMLAGQATLTLPARTHRRVIVEVETYVCAYQELVVSGGGGAVVRVLWQEALSCDPAVSRAKGRRDEIEGKYFIDLEHRCDGVGDTYRPDGGRRRRFESLWWHAGRYVQFLVSTGDAPLTIESFALRKTRYPLEPESSLALGPRFARFESLAVRTLQLCAHETYMDCPYYEQLMYAGDTRVEALLTYALTRDDRLPRKALRLFAWSRLPNGLTQSRYPSRVRQVIPPFSLCWIGMVFDFAWWRGDGALLRELLPVVRGILDYFLERRDARGVLVDLPGWNYLDWVPAWQGGSPPTGDRGASASFNWKLVLALRQAATLEEHAGEPELAARFNRHADAGAAATHRLFWDEQRHLFAEDVAHAHFSEHAQCLALLAGGVPPEARARFAGALVQAPDLARASIYFSHYLFEAYHLLGCEEALFRRLELWLDLPQLGFVTTPEQPEPSRSDCHAWAAHPLFHGYATILGIRPAAPGFARVRIAPMMGALDSAAGALVHPRGEIAVAFRRAGERLAGTVTLPPGVEGELQWRGRALALQPGPQSIAL